MKARRPDYERSFTENEINTTNREHASYVAAQEVLKINNELVRSKRAVNPGIYGGGGDGRAVGRSAR